MSARLIVFEGPDGVGKTTLSNALALRLAQQDVPCEVFAFPGQDPGTLGNLVYKIHHLHTAEFGISRINPTSLQLLHVAAHVDAIEAHVLPSLQLGRTVILDRYWWSTWIYGLLLGVNSGRLKAMLHVEKLVWDDILPVAVFLVERLVPDSPDVAPYSRYSLEEEYRILAAKEASCYPVITVRNDSTIDDSIDGVLSALVPK